MFQKATIATLAVLLLALLYTQLSSINISQHLQLQSMQATTKNLLQRTFSKSRNMSTLAHANIVPRRSGDRGHADHGWLNTYHTFSFADYHDSRYMDYGSLRVLNEDRVAPKNGFPTHPHRDFEIFSYVLSGELTHRDSIKGKGNAAGASKDDFYVMKRGDVQFTTGGTGIAHSEQNENQKDWVHFLQIWVKPWARGLPPTYHTSTFEEQDKRAGFVNIISPLTGGPHASAEQEKAAEPVVKGTIPIHADVFMGASIIEPGKSHGWKVGGDAAAKKADRKVYVHLPATQGGKSKVKLSGKEEITLSEGDGAFVGGVNMGDELMVESIGAAAAEVVVLDSD